MTLDELRDATQQLVGQRKSFEHTIADLEAELKAAEAEQVILQHVSSAFDVLIQRVSQDSTGGIEQLVSHGLRTVFPDLVMAFKLLIENKRGVQWAQPVLSERGVEAPVLDAFGGGPAAIVAFLLRLLVCRRLGLAPVLLLDEPFSFVSSAYVDDVARLLRELADAAGVTIVMVTHDPTYVSRATYAYEAIDGGFGGNTFHRIGRGV